MTSNIEQLRQSSPLEIDNARLFVVNKLNKKVTLWTQYEECYKVNLFYSLLGHLKMILYFLVQLCTNS